MVAPAIVLQHLLQRERLVSYTRTDQYWQATQWDLIGSTTPRVRDSIINMSLKLILNVIRNVDINTLVQEGILMLLADARHHLRT